LLEHDWKTEVLLDSGEQNWNVGFPVDLTDRVLGQASEKGEAILRKKYVSWLPRKITILKHQ
jgi:hypothetical protein